MILTIVLLFIMFVGYLVAFLMIARVFMVASSLHNEVPFVPSAKKYLAPALEALELLKGDKVVDLGSGDGKFLIFAAKKYPDIQFTGIEINSMLCRWGRMMAFLNGVKNVKFVNADINSIDLAEFNKVYLYMTTGFISRLMPKIEKEIKKGSRVVSLYFGFGDRFNETHDVKSIKIEGTKKDNISVWIKE